MKFICRVDPQAPLSQEIKLWVRGLSALDDNFCVIRNGLRGYQCCRQKVILSLCVGA